MSRSIFIVLVLLLGPTAYEFCGNDIKPYFSITGLRIINAKFNDSSEFSWALSKSDVPVEWSRFFMMVDFETDYFTQRELLTSSNLMADCPPSGYKGSKVGIDTLYLVTLTNYNETFMAGDTLNNITLIQESRFNPIQQYIEDNREKVLVPYFRLKLSEAPGFDGDHQFKLIYLLANGQTFEGQTDMVKLSK